MDFGFWILGRRAKTIRNPKSKIQNEFDRLVWVLLAFAFLFRVVYNLALHSDGHPLSAFVIDEREYFGAAHVLAEGRGFSFFDTALWVRPPLYVVFLAPFVRLFDDNTFLVLVAQSLLSAATLLPLGWLAQHLGGSQATRWTVGLGVVYLPFTLFAGLLLSEILFVFLFSLTLVALVLAQTAFAGSDYAVGLRWAGVAGVLLGLSTLTRATALGFAPLVAVWMWFSCRRSVDMRKLLVAGGVMLACCGLVLVPWIVRNYRAYGKFIAVDTTSGYNLWLGSVGVRDEERLQADLRPITNPASRQAYAYARAWENIQADPLAFARKGLKESLDLWKPLFSAEERQVRGYIPGRVPAWHLYSLLAFDDLLYLLVLLLSIAGLFLVPAQPLRSLTVLWVLLWVAMSFVFFAVTRFRLPVVAALLPWAGAGASLMFPVRGVRERLVKLPVAARAAMAALILVVLVVVLPAISFADMQLGAERWEQQASYRAGEAQLRDGFPSDAVRSYRRANMGIADTRYGLAAALLQTGDTQGALGQLTQNESPDRFEPFIIRGEAARLSGNLDAARTFFNQRVVKLAGDMALQWAWDHLNPEIADKIDVGSGLDVGYVHGFYGPETDSGGQKFRWMSGQAEVRNLRAIAGSQVRFVWSGWRPDALPQARVRASLPLGIGKSDQIVDFDLANKPDWTVSDMRPDFPGDAITGPLDIRLSANDFVPGGSDQRLVGVRVSQVGGIP